MENTPKDISDEERDTPECPTALIDQSETIAAPLKTLKTEIASDAAVDALTENS